MKPFYLFFIALFCLSSIKSQTVIVSGACMTGTITLDPAGVVDGKPSYEGIGTVDEIEDVAISVFWKPEPDNLWVLAFSGQPYFQQSCDEELPWGTVNASCPWSLVSGQTCTGGTPLALRGAGALVVNLLSFTARLENKQVVVKWKTATETNNKGFDIQRSQDALNWSDIGFVSGTINSTIERSYQFNDTKPLQKKSFYRLRQVDLDGKYTYSQIAAVSFQKSGYYSIANNPSHGQYKLHIESGTEKLNFSVIDAAGRRILTRLNNSPGDQTIDISRYSSGIYLLKVQIGSSVFTERLIKL